MLLATHFIAFRIGTKAVATKIPAAFVEVDGVSSSSALYATPYGDIVVDVGNKYLLRNDAPPRILLLSNQYTSVGNHLLGPWDLDELQLKGPGVEPLIDWRP